MSSRLRSRDVEKLRPAVRETCLREFEDFAGQPWNETFLAWATPPRAENAVENEAKEIVAELKRALRRAKEFADRPTSVPMNEHLEAMPQPPIGRSVSSFLRWWVPSYIAPLLEQTYLQDEPNAEGSWSPNAAGPLRSAVALGVPIETERLTAAEASDDKAKAAIRRAGPFEWHIVTPRSWLVSVWDVHWGAYAGGRDRPGIQQRERLNPRQYAVVSLLAGNWPRELATIKVAITDLKVIELETKAMRIAIKRHGVADVPRAKSKKRKQPG